MPHRSARRRPVTTVALIAATAVVAVTVPAIPASARGEAADAASRTMVSAKADPGALPAKLSPTQRETLLRQAGKAADETGDRLGLGAKEELQVRDVLKDADGTVHTRYERTYAGLPVLGGDLIVHESKSGNIEGVTRSYESRLQVSDLSAAVSRAAAQKQAVSAAKSEGSARNAADSTRTVVWAAKGTPTLAYETVVGGLQDDGTPSELHVITDAQTGRKLYEYQAVKTGVGNGLYSGTVTIGTTPSDGTYQLSDSARGGHRTYDLNQGSSGTGTLYTDDDDVWGSGAQSDRQTAGVDAHYGAQETWDFYQNTFGRNGIGNDGVGAYSRVHYGNSYVNAFWDDSCFCMTYGDGLANANPLTSLDVAAHEMSHGVTAATAGLIYSDESGGLNEATSDIFATAAEFYADNAVDVPDYEIGELVDINHDGTPLRYMDKPSRDGISRDSWFAGLGNLDVHYSSGPANHFFYLLSEGSGTKTINGVTYNSPTHDGLPVPGIGLADAEQIWYRALSTYMTSNTGYAGARNATMQAAADLFGAGSATYETVVNTWAAVNVGGRIVHGTSVTNPGAQVGVTTVAANLQILALTTNTDAALSYAATGLPDGLTIDPGTGLVSGTPTVAGTFSPTVTVTDTTGSAASVTFSWLINAAESRVWENPTDIDIPDGGPAIESPVLVGGRTGNAPSNLQVYVKIVHQWRGDVVIDLVAPDGSTYRLKDASGDSDRNIERTYTVDASSQTANGTWKLRVEDIYPVFNGYLDTWKLIF